MSDRTDHVLSAIDHAVSDWEVGPDAMRSMPDLPPAPEVDAHALATDAAVRALSDALDRSGTTRAGLIEAGHLVEAPAGMAAEAGWTVPVAVTRALWLDMVEWPDSEACPQDESGRWWDVLWMSAFAARRNRARGGMVRAGLFRVPRGGMVAEKVTVEVSIGPGDDGGPAVTLSLPQEG